MMAGIPEAAHGVGSAAAFAVAGLLSGPVAGPDTCVPVGAIVLLAVASPRDVWAIARRRFDLPTAGQGGGGDD
jgi:hypothetical protein